MAQTDRNTDAVSQTDTDTWHIQKETQIQSDIHTWQTQTETQIKTARQTRMEHTDIHCTH